MKYYIIAGEASGDLHASNLIRELKKLDRDAVFRCWGGDLMKEQGAFIVKHISELAFMGFLEVVKNIGAILTNLRLCKADILSFQPDVLILVDYPGFNLRIAGFAHKAGIRVFYYISPQVWAWKKSRVFRIREVVDRMFVILPFEKEFYARYGIDVDFTGHPLLDVIDPDRKHAGPVEIPGDPSFPLVALLPGSRRQEIEMILPVMVSVTESFPGHRFVIAGAPSVDPEFYGRLCRKGQIPVLYGRTHDLIRQASAALVTSGTATLETALIGTPQAVCYKGGRISYQIARRLIRVRYISLVNLIMNFMLVREFIQADLNRENLAAELHRLLDDPEYRKRITDGYSLLVNRLGEPGASARAASMMFHSLPSRKNES